MIILFWRLNVNLIRSIMSHDRNFSVRILASYYSVLIGSRMKTKRTTIDSIVFIVLFFDGDGWNMFKVFIWNFFFLLFSLFCRFLSLSIDTSPACYLLLISSRHVCSWNAGLLPCTWCLLLSFDRLERNAALANVLACDCVRVFPTLPVPSCFL